MPVTQADIDLAHRLADAAGAVIRPYFRRDFGLEIKDDQSPVTLADREAETAMRRLLDAERSGDGVIGEEYGEKPGVTNRKWVLDPIDGTRSFTVGRAIFGTLIALVEDGWPVLGIIDQPVQRERWVGVAGRPTTFNGVPVRTRTCSTLEGAIVEPASSRQVRVRTGTPFKVVGRPATPTQRSRWTGWSIIPSTGQPSSTSAINVPKIARPTVKLRVPSIGSSTHLRLVTPVFSPNSSPTMPSPERSASSSRRIADSASRSARVTGDWSSLISTPCSWRK